MTSILRGPKLFALIASLLCSASLLAGTPVTCADKGPLLKVTAGTNAVLNSNECLISENKEFVAVMQSDGNFVVYPYTGYGDPKAARFRTGTAGHPGAHLEAQQDRQVVVYETDHSVLWHACDRVQVFGLFNFKLLNNGRLEMNSVVDGNEQLIWASDSPGC